MARARRYQPRLHLRRARFCAPCRGAMLAVQCHGSSHAAWRRCVLLRAAGSALATTLYRWVDAQGVVHYSDTPQPGAQEIQIQPPQTYRAPAVRSGSGRRRRQRAACADRTLPLMTPARIHAARTRDNPSCSPKRCRSPCSLRPGLQPGDQVTCTVDGAPLPTSSRHASIRSRNRNAAHIRSAPACATATAKRSARRIAGHLQRAATLVAIAAPRRPAVTESLDCAPARLACAMARCAMAIENFARHRCRISIRQSCWTCCRPAWSCSMRTCAWSTPTSVRRICWRSG